MSGNNFDLFIEHRDLIHESLRRYINRARLFLFDIYPTEAFSQIPEAELSDLCYNFCLPFPVVAVEDKTSCVIMWDKDRDSVGLDCTRHMLEICDLRNYLDDKSFQVTDKDILFGRSPDYKDKQDAMIEGFKEDYGEYPLIVKYGVGNLDWGGDDNGCWVGNMQVGSCFQYFPKQKKMIDVLELAEGDDTQMRLDFVRAMGTAYEELLSMSRRSQFIMEEKPKLKGKQAKKKKYFTSKERPTYTVVNPRKARNRMGVRNGTGAGTGKKVEERRAYIRREHDRILRSEKFTKKQGQTVKVKRTYVPAIWQGESVGEDDRHYYKVILDLPKGLIGSCS